VIGVLPVVNVLPVVGDGPVTGEGGSSAPGHPTGGSGAVQVPFAGETPAVATTVSAAPAEAGAAVPGRPAARAAVPLSPDFFILPDPAETHDLPDESASASAGERAADGLTGTAEADAVFADFALWGTADGNLWADGVAPEPAGRVAAAGSVTGAAVPAPAVSPDGAAALPESQEAGLLTAFVPYDVGALDAAFRRLLDQLGSLGWDFTSLLVRLQGTPWVVAFAAMAVTCEACRRRVARARDRLAPAGGGAGTLTWFPSHSTHESGDEG
jgi:hypothetical protein